MTNFHSIDATQVTNVTLNVKDLNKLTDFYSNVLGFLLKTNESTNRIQHRKSWLYFNFK